MSIAIITGSCGLIGNEATRFFHDQGLEVHGIDNNFRQYFFGKESSTTWQQTKLEQELPHYHHHSLDIRDRDKLEKLFKHLGKEVAVVIHTAAQPSHDWAAKEPHTDFSINALGTLNLLELCRQHCPEAPFIFTSTNKVYGDTPNHLPLVEKKMRWEIDKSHVYHQHGIDESMSIDQSMHSVFGASKISADIMTQEYGRYFGLKTAIFRGGCLTGPAHSGAELHGFLSYLVKCAVTNKPYTIFGYKGKQVRDNIHSHDLITAFWQFFLNPREGEVYNMGGGQYSNCSVLEAIEKIDKKTNTPLKYTLSDEARSGDHIWWISDVQKFKNHYPHWKHTYNIDKIISEIIEASSERHGKSLN